MTKVPLISNRCRKRSESTEKGEKVTDTCEDSKERHHTVNNDIKGEKMEAIFGHPVHSDGLATIGF